MMIAKFTTSTLALFLSFPIFAGTMEHDKFSSVIPWYVGAYGGYGHVSGGYKWGQNTTLGRFAIGASMLRVAPLNLGTEIGFQSGNTMRLYASPNIIESQGGLPIQSQLKPMVDWLAVVKGQFKPDLPIFYSIKGGGCFQAT